ncbi:MAG: relaxase/mobilization nuclease domain-containing protein [Cetobacterium sp.]|uniref:relaxase/mobilization nuclease domain-containing protein n=1 Tax=Cetobacterium sp. TaxID=2071632 RepID=UPI003F3F6DD9
MAIFKSIDNPSTKIGGSKKAIDYIAKKAEITKGFNCSDDREQAYKDFQETKEFYGKMDGRQFKHFILSFEEGRGTPEIAINMGEDIAKTLFKDYEVFLAVHTDTENTHCHLLVNSVNLNTGNKYRHSKYEYEIYKEKVVEIGLNYGIEPTQEKEKEIGEVRTDSKEKRKAIENHFNDVQKSDIVNTYMILTNVLENEKIKSIDEFKNKMDKEGIIVDWEPQKKNITFEIKPEFANSKKRKFRLSNLNKTFSDERLTKENLENGFEITKQLEQEKQKEIQHQQKIEKQRKIRDRDDFDLGF